MFDAVCLIGFLLVGGSVPAVGVYGATSERESVVMENNEQREQKDATNMMLMQLAKGSSGEAKRAALELLVRQNEGLIAHALRVFGTFQNDEDLQQEARLALIRAVDSYDETQSSASSRSLIATIHSFFQLLNLIPIIFNFNSIICVFSQFEIDS